MGARAILLIVAVVLFVLAAFDVGLGDIELVPLGLAALTGSFLVGSGSLVRH